MAGFTTLPILDATATSRTFAFYQDASSNFYSAPVLTDAAGHVLGVSANPLYVQFSALPAGSNAIGSVSVSNFPGSQSVTGTFWQTTQPVSIASLPSLPAGSAAIGSVSVSNFPATQPVSGAVTISSGTCAVTGTFWQTTQPVSLAALPALTAGSAAIGSVTITSGTCAVTGTFWQTTQPVSGTFWQATQPVSGTFWPTTQPVSAVASATGGCSTYSLIALATTNANNVKASAGTLKSVQVYNLGAAAVFLKLYNSATAPTAGSGTPVKRIMIPGNTAGGAGANFNLPPEGVAFPAGIGFTCTGAIADNDTTAVTAANILINLDYE